MEFVFSASEMTEEIAVLRKAVKDFVDIDKESMRKVIELLVENAIEVVPDTVIVNKRGVDVVKHIEVDGTTALSLTADQCMRILKSVGYYTNNPEALHIYNNVATGLAKKLSEKSDSSVEDLMETFATFKIAEDFVSESELVQNALVEEPVSPPPPKKPTLEIQVKTKKSKFAELTELAKTMKSKEEFVKLIVHEFAVNKVLSNDEFSKLMSIEIK
jgi:hypothetical protein